MHRIFDKLRARALGFLMAVLASQAAAFAQAPAWDDAAVESLSFALSEAWTHGLDPRDYGDANRLLEEPPGPRRDALASGVFQTYASHLAFGRVDPRRLDGDWTAPVRDQDIDAWMARALSTGDVYGALEALAPQHPDYAALRSELVYRMAVTEPETLIARGPTLGLGDYGPRVDALRTRLAQLSMLDAPAPDGTPFDQRLQTALMRFQARHNLAGDGRMGETTRRELNAGRDRRIDQLRANLERWRWLTADLGARHIRVNIADYRLEAWQDGEMERVHNIMIGQLYSRTPVFSETMSYIELNPVWYTPGGLGARWVRTFRTNPAYALSQGYRLVSLDTGRVVDPYSADWSHGRYRVIQRPGPNNAMGEVKFMFPNRHNVYIHDTPHRALFANSQRDDSSGCMRVQHPVDLAWWVLDDEPGWSRLQLDEVLATDDTRRVYLDEPIEVHILYFTAVADRFGEVRFIHDVYGRDDAVIAALNGIYPALPEEDALAALE